ncbi:GNAT family protein [Pseudomonas sp.]|uniref:GNAT family protein n=1 Tax=Pseudomonas sp. TaxID=306 RepID=UPI0028A6064C|nr:GNAT family protein [Pseudomonas sp.]
MNHALSTLQQYVKRKGLRGAFNGLIRRFVYRHEELLWMERDLVTPPPPHQLKAYPPLRMERISVHNVQAFARHFGDRIQTMRDLAAEGHTGLMWLDERDDCCVFIWASTRDYHDRHYYGCWFAVQPGEYFQFGGESARRYWGTQISTDAQLRMFQEMAAQGFVKVVDVCESHNIPALRLHLRMGYHEQGRVVHIHHLFGRWKLFRETRYSGSCLAPLRKAAAPSAAAA